LTLTVTPSSSFSLRSIRAAQEAREKSRELVEAVQRFARTR
jgi:hypothetical protein